MGVADERDALALSASRRACSIARKVLPLPAPPRTSTRLSSWMASRMTAWCSVSASAASSLARARATTRVAVIPCRSTPLSAGDALLSEQWAVESPGG